jgi:hypothetical protein
VTNGFKFTITIQNTGSSPVSAGLRKVIDTHLGEENRDAVFITNRQIINNETILRGTSGELFWISKNQDYSLMGSIVDPLNPDSRIPDYLHIANWRRLYNVQWAMGYTSGRSFNYRPYSIRDSAVSYYWEPAMLGAGESFVYTVYLTTEDFAFYGLAPAVNMELTSSIDINALLSNAEGSDLLMLMYRLQETLNRFIAGEIYLDEKDLDEIERAIDGLR